MLDSILRFCFIALSGSVLSMAVLGMGTIEIWKSIEISVMCIIGSLILEVRAALKMIWEKLDKDVSNK